MGEWGHLQDTDFSVRLSIGQKKFLRQPMAFCIGIYGGMGPFTGYAFFGKIIDRLKKLQINDSLHPQILFYSDPTMPRRDYCVLAIEDALRTQTSETIMTAKIDPSIDARPALLVGLEIFKNCDRILVPC